MFLNPEFQRELDSKTHSRLTNQNSVLLLQNSDSLRLKTHLIRTAKTSIWLSTFQIVCDQGGKDFARELNKAAKRGVEVRFLITGGPWTWAFAGNCQELMKESGVNIATMPYSYITNHGVVQLHDKIFVVDSKQAIVGGQNIGSWYNKKRQEDTNFRDTDASITGPVTLDIIKRFVTLWKFAKPADRSIHLPETPNLQTNYPDWLKTRPLTGLCRFVSQTPSQKDYSVFKAYRLYASQTQNRLIFHSLNLNTKGSYEQESLWKAFVEVSERPGGEVFFLTNGPGFLTLGGMPEPLGRLVGHYFLRTVYQALKNTSVQTFVYPTWLHSKVYQFDNLVTAIGSFNFDETGLVWTESSLICLDQNLNEQIKSMFIDDLKNSYLLKPSLHQPISRLHSGE